jgi:hypothetical protein
MLHTEALTVGQAAHLLALTRQAVEGRIKKQQFSSVPGSPTRVLTSEVRSLLAERLEESERLVSRLLAGAIELGIRTAGTMAGAESPARGLHDDRRTDELLKEMTGRALAEQRITQLETEMRRMKQAIAALTPDPDVSIDVPGEP